jgi:multiple sugar transport system substrate-binding protein
MPLAGTNIAVRRAPKPIVAALLLALFAAGCPSESNETNDASHAATKPPPVVRLLVVDDKPLAAAIEREWKASGRGDVEIAQATASQLADAKRLAADVVVYPAALLGDFAERHLIVELPAAASENAAFASSDIFPLLRRRECTWGEKAYAVPFGSPQLMLIYRQDLLEKLGRQPPATWADYQDLLTALGELSTDEAKLRPTAEPLAQGWGAKLLLARGAAYARHPNQYSALFDYRTMEPLIATPPYVRALEELVAAQHAASPAQPLDAAGCEQAIVDGKCAMAITWPTRNAQRAEKVASDIRLGCSELPGAAHHYSAEAAKWTDADEASHVPLLGVSGRLGSITSSARHTRAATDALLWLAGKEKGPLIATQSSACTLSRSSQVPQASRFVSDAYDSTFAGEYGAALLAANERPLSMEMPRIPGHDAYLAALDAAVRSAVAGEKQPADALADAAQQWREITAKFGVEGQKIAYVRSLGLEP